MCPNASASYAHVGFGRQRRSRVSGTDRKDEFRQRNVANVADSDQLVPTRERRSSRTDGSQSNIPARFTRVGAIRSNTRQRRPGRCQRHTWRASRNLLAARGRCRERRMSADTD